jgi:hypothetical protein
MGDEFQSGICGGGGNWWNNIPVTSKNVFSSSSPCSSVILSSDNNMGIIRGYNSPSSADEPACSISDGSIIFHDIQKPHEPPHLTENMVAGNMDSTLQMMCIGLSSSTATDWDHQSLLNGKGEGNYHNRMLHDDMDTGNLNYGHKNEDWSTPRNFMSQDSSTKSSMNHHQLGFSIPMTTNSSNSYAYNPSTMLQNMFDTSDSSHPSSQSQFDNSNLVNYSPNNYRSKLNEISPSFPKFSSFLKSSLQQKPQNDNFSFYNTSAQIDTGPNFFPLMQPQYQSLSFEGKPSCPNITRKSNNDEVDSGSVTKKIGTTNEPPLKKPRIQAPSPLPTFKVRKEKLGDRITALQQLVSPFGKTDTASVLHEAIEYIKILHDQVHVFSTPYLKNGSPLQLHQNVGDNSSSEGAKKDLRSRGLCLVPLSSTFPVAADSTHNTPDYWGSTFGATYR